MAILIALLACAGLLAAQSTHQFHPPPSPGEAIKLAARATAQARPRTNTAPIEIFTDTQGMDFGPYLQGAFAKVRQNWYKLIPESAQMKKGKLAIAFSVLKDGELTGMKVVESSGDVSLDRAALGGIAASDPFPALPTGFTGDHIGVRFRFFYNLASVESTEIPSTAPDFVAHAVLVQNLADSNSPKYPKNALDAKIEGLVRLEGMIGANGELKDLKVIEVTRTWRQPLQMRSRNDVSIPLRRMASPSKSQPASISCFASMANRFVRDLCPPRPVAGGSEHLVEEQLGLGDVFGDPNDPARLALAAQASQMTYPSAPPAIDGTSRISSPS